MRKLILIAMLLIALTVRSSAQAPTTYTVVVPDSLKAKGTLFYGVWTNKFNDSTTLMVGLNEKSQIIFGRMLGKDSIDVINEGIWKVKPNMLVAEIEITWVSNPGQGVLFYHEEGTHYLFVKQLKFQFDSALTKRLH